MTPQQSNNTAKLYSVEQAITSYIVHTAYTNALRDSSLTREEHVINALNTLKRTGTVFDWGAATSAALAAYEEEVASWEG